MNPDESHDRSRREWLAVAVVTCIGACLRVWPPGRLGLDHFDEAIYALAASWVFDPKGLAAIDPNLIPYAPPGFPILGGLAYAVLGPSDGAMIAVSQLAGTMTIPVVAGLARRTFGPGAGYAAAVFCAFSGPHIAFSRMALTDASFLLAWLLAVGAGMRFLDRPGFIRAIALGLTVGLAQQFKYNGWLVGGIVIATAALGLAVRPEERRSVAIGKTFGWGGLAAAVAWLVVWPWYRFVEAHGGYAGLLRHQRKYLGGFGDWWPNFLIQGDQATALSDFWGWIWFIGLALATLTFWIARPPTWTEATRCLSPLQRLAVAVNYGFLPGVFVFAPYGMGLLMAPWVLSWPRASVRLVGVWWLVLSAMTPFYHPYARLWLPYHAANWLMMGWVVANGFAVTQAGQSRAGLSGAELRRHRILHLKRFGTISLLLASASFPFLATVKRHARPQPGLLDPRDSLRQACREVAKLLPGEVEGLRVLARPAVPYYLPGRVTVVSQDKLEKLMAPGSPRIWALVDWAIVRSEMGPYPRKLPGSIANHWEVVAEIPTTLSLPTLLDLDPGAAREDAADRSAPLWLLRPRRPGVPR